MTLLRKCREAKDEEVEQKCREAEDLENRNETKKMYQLVRQLAPEEKPKQNKAISDKNGSLLCEKDKINKRWKEYMEELYDSKLERPEYKTTENDEISLVEIFNAARGISNNKSPGSDGIPIEFLKYGGNRTLSQICQLIHRIYQQEKDSGRVVRLNLSGDPKKGRNKKMWRAQNNFAYTSRNEDLMQNNVQSD